MEPAGPFQKSVNVLLVHELSFAFVSREKKIGILYTILLSWLILWEYGGFHLFCYERNKNSPFSSGESSSFAFPPF
jgi:hypothetical protein